MSDLKDVKWEGLAIVAVFLVGLLALVAAAAKYGLGPFSTIRTGPAAGCDNPTQRPVEIDYRFPINSDVFLKEIVRRELASADDQWAVRVGWVWDGTDQRLEFWAYNVTRDQIYQAQLVCYLDSPDRGMAIPVFGEIQIEKIVEK